MSDPDPPTQERLWVDIESPQDIVVTGLLQILQSEFGASLFTTVGPADGEPDVVLYDVIGLHAGDASELERLRLTESVVIAVSYDGLRRDLETLALDRGATAVIPLSISAEELAEVIRAAVDGRLEDVPAVRTRHHWAYPGKEVGLSPRESDVLALIVRGMSNEEIARECYLSVNSVKTYIRSAYRKIGVKHRAQAVVWAMTNGFGPASES